MTMLEMARLTFGRRTCAFFAVLVLTALLVATALALAAKPVKSGHYSGFVTGVTDETVTFTVSKDGKSIQRMRIVPYVFSCGVGGPPPPESSKPASISSKGKFTAKVTQGALSATVTGTFLKNGRETGTITATVTGSPACHRTYSTKAK
jgi:hypothetical protein